MYNFFNLVYNFQLKKAKCGFSESIYWLLKGLIIIAKLCKKKLCTSITYAQNLNNVELYISNGVIFKKVFVFGNGTNSNYYFIYYDLVCNIYLNCYHSKFVALCSKFLFFSFCSGIFFSINYSANVIT